MERTENVFESRTAMTRPKPEIVRTRQFDIPIRGSSFRPTANQLSYRDEIGRFESPMQSPRQNNFAWMEKEARLMAKQSDEGRKTSRLRHYHQDTPIPLRYHDRLSYDMPHGIDHSTPIQTESFSRLPQDFNAPVSSPCIDYRSRRKDTNDYGFRYSGERPGNAHMYDQEDTRSKILEDCEFVCAKSGGYDNAGSFYRRNGDCNQLNSFWISTIGHRLDSLRDDPRLSGDYALDCKPDCNISLPDARLKNDGLAKLPIQGSLNGLESNVHEISFEGDLLNGILSDFVTYSQTDYPHMQFKRAQPTRVQACNHSNSNPIGDEYSESKSKKGIYSKNSSEEPPHAKKTNDRHFSSTNGAAEEFSPEANQRPLDENTECNKNVQTVPIKQCIVGELDLDQIKRNPEQRRDNTRSIVQFVLTSNTPNREKEADNFITLIDESFEDYCTDKGLNKRSVAENLLDEKTINGVNKGIQTERPACFMSSEDRVLCNENCDNKSTSNQNRYSGRNKASQVSCLIAKDRERDVHQLPYSKVDAASNGSPNCVGRSSFEQIKRQLFIDAGLSEEKSDVIGEETNLSGDLSFVRTVYQNVGEKRSVGERIDKLDEEFVCVVSKSAGRLVHNNDKNPKANAIFKTQSAQLKANRNNKSPFIRTVYQDRGRVFAGVEDVNTSGRPVSPFSDSIISAVATCTQGRKRNDYLRSRRRDRRLRYLSEPGIFRYVGSRLQESMDKSCSGSSCDEIGNTVNSVSNGESTDTSMSSDLTEHALRAHTQALKVNSPNIRRRPTLNQFFGKISEQGLQDNLSENSDMTCHSDSVLMVQRTNIVNLTPVSGLVRDSSGSNSRAHRLKAWKSRHKNIFKGSNNTTKEGKNSNGSSDSLSQTSERFSDGRTTGKECKVMKDEIDGNAIIEFDSEHGKNVFMSDTDLEELSQLHGELDNQQEERVMECIQEKYPETVKKNPQFHGIDHKNFDINCRENSLKNDAFSMSKSVESDDSFEEVFIEPELQSCSPPINDRNSDSTDSSDHEKRNQESSPNESKSKKDSLDVFVGSASAILERVKRLKLKYNHKTTLIQPYNDEKDLNCNLIRNPNNETDDVDRNLSPGCLIPSPTLLKDSPKIKTLDKSNIFSRSPTWNLSSLDSEMNYSNMKKNRELNGNLSKRSTDSLDDLRPELITNNSFHSGEDIYSSLAKNESDLNRGNLTEAHKLLNYLYRTGKPPMDETKGHPQMDETKGDIDVKYGSLLIEKDLTNVNDAPSSPSLNADDFFVLEEEMQLTHKQPTVLGTSTCEKPGYGETMIQSNAQDEYGLKRLNEAGNSELKQTEDYDSVSKQINVTNNPNHLTETNSSGKCIDWKKGIDNVNSYIEGNECNEDITLENCVLLNEENQQKILPRNEHSPNHESFSTDEVWNDCTPTTDGQTSRKFISNTGKKGSLINEPVPCGISSLTAIERDIADEDGLTKRNNEDLSLKIEKVRTDNAKEISSVIYRKDNIQNEEFLHLNGVLNSKGNLIIRESKGSSTEKADADNFATGLPSEQDADNTSNGSKGSPTEYCENASSFNILGISVDRLAADGKEVATEEYMEDQTSDQVKPDDEKSKSESNRFQISKSVNIDEDLHSQKAIRDDVECYRLTAIDDIGQVIAEIFDGMETVDSSIGMAQGKGVTDLKRHFEKYQPKGEKHADAARNNSSKAEQVFNGLKHEAELFDIRSIDSSTKSTKFGALKSIFEGKGTGKAKSATTRISSPILERSKVAMKNMESHEVAAKNHYLTAGKKSTGTNRMMNGSDKEDSQLKDNEQSIVGKENPVISVSRDIQENGKIDADCGRNEERTTPRKTPKIPPPVKRKPSLKKTTDNGSKIKPCQEASLSGGILIKTQQVKTNRNDVDQMHGDEINPAKEKGEGHAQFDEENRRGRAFLSDKSAVGKGIASSKEENLYTEESGLENKYMNEENDITVKKDLFQCLEEKAVELKTSAVEERKGMDTEDDVFVKESKNTTRVLGGLIDENQRIETGISDIAQLRSFDKLEDVERNSNKAKEGGLLKGAERCLENSPENELEKNFIQKKEKTLVSEKGQIDVSGDSCLLNAGDFLNIVTEGQLKLEKTEKEEKGDTILFLGCKDEMESDLTHLKSPASTQSQIVELNHSKCLHGDSTEMEPVQHGPNDQEGEIMPNPIGRLEEASNPIKDEKARLKGDLETSGKRNICGEDKGKTPCQDDNGLMNASLSQTIHDERLSVFQYERKTPAIRSNSNSSDSSLEDIEPMRLKQIDYDSLPSIGLPALLRERETHAEAQKDAAQEAMQDQLKMNGGSEYMSYSRKASDIKSHSEIIGMYSQTDERSKTSAGNCYGQAASMKETELKGMQPKKAVLVDLESKHCLTENEVQPRFITGSTNGDASLVNDRESFEDFPVSVASKSTKTHAPIISQTISLTSERSNSPNIAKVSPYFHDSNSRRFIEPVSKFAGGTFSNALQDDSDVLSNDTSEHKDLQRNIGCPVMQNKDTQGQTKQKLNKLRVFLNIPKDALRDDVYVNLGVVSTDGISHWQETEEQVSRILQEHLKQISSDCLGISAKDIEGFQIGKHSADRGDGKELTPHSKDGDENTCTFQFQGDSLSSVASLAYQLLLPKRTIEKYLSLAMDHRCLIFCGPSGTGKSCLASKIAFAVASRIGENDNNNNMSEPIHAVNVNAERWKEVKKIVKQRLLQSIPVILVIDGFSPDFHDGMENLSQFFKQMDNNQVYIIAALNQATYEITVKWQNSIRWIWLSNNEEPVNGLLVRYLRKKFINNNERASLDELFRIADWISSLWQHLNTIIETFHSTEQTIGPAMFFSCPWNQNEIEEWFVDTWNYSLAPYILHTLRTGLKRYGQRCDWIDPLQWVTDTYPWRHKASHVMNLKKIRKSDVGFWDMDMKEKDMNKSSADQIRLMNFLRRLETLVDNKKISTETRPGTTQRRIYLESTL